MNAKRLAEVLGLHPNTIYNMIRSGEIHAVKDGKSFEIPDFEVERLKVKNPTVNAKYIEYIDELLKENGELKEELKRVENELNLIIKSIQSK